MYRLISVSANFIAPLIACLTIVMTAQAQVAPSSNEVSKYTGLLAAAHSGDLSELESLIKAGSDLEIRDGNGRTPLLVAVFASQNDAVQLLAEAGADMNAFDRSAYDGVTIAAVADDPEMVKLALSLGNSSGNITSPYEGTALIAAAHLGHVDVVKLLISAKAPLDHVNNLNWTALIEAVVLGDGGPKHVEIVRALLSAGADKSIGDRQGVVPLEHAQTRGYSEIVDLLEQNQ